MANLHAIHSVSRSLVNYLRSSFPDDLIEGNCNFRVLSSGQQNGTAVFDTSVSLWLYRLTTNEHQRDVVPVRRPEGYREQLALDLHFLLTVWATSAIEEQTLMAWAMAQMHQRPLLQIANLSDELLLPGEPHPAGWTNDDVLQLVQESMSTEDLMRIWDALPYGYRLSTPYIVRVIRLDIGDPRTPAFVSSSRLRIGAEEDDDDSA